MSPQTLADSALAFVRAYRALQDLPEAARRVAVQATTAGADDLDALGGILKTLNVPPGLDHAEEQGKDLDNRLRSLADQAANEAHKVGVRAQYRAAVLAAQAEAAPGTVAVADFGPGAVKVLELIDQPAASRFVVYGDVSRLNGDHPLVAKLAGADLPTVDGDPVAYLGRPVTGLDGRLVPAPSYPIDQAARWTVEAGRREKEQAELEKWEREEADRKAREAHRRPLPPEQVAEAVGQLLDRVRVLEAAKAKE